MLEFLIGWIFGILTIIVGAVAYILLPSRDDKPPRTQFAEQFQPLIIPQELRDFIKSGKDGRGLSEEESCFSISLIFHFLYQEHKDTRQFRRWIHKRLQLELNDLTTRSAAGRLIEEIRIRDLCVGNQFPVFNNIRVESVKMNDIDKELFETVSFIVDMDYKGGFETSVDIKAALSRYGHLAIKVTRVSGKIRVTLSRQPYAHWCVSFIEMPELDFKIESQIQGRQLKTLIPLISTALKKAVARKHVFPQYKIRYRPFFPNPILQPSAPMDAFRDVPVKGAIEVTVLQCSRLNTILGHSKSAPNTHTDVYCVVSLEQRPFIDNSDSSSIQSYTIQLKYARHNLTDPLGLTFSKSVAELGLRSVQVAEVEASSIADKGGFKTGDVILAVNNVPVRNERQVTKLLSGTVGELIVLVQRLIGDEDQDQGPNDNLAVTEEHDNEFVLLRPSSPTGLQRCHSDGAILSGSNSTASTIPSSPTSADLHFSATEPIFCMEETVRDEVHNEEDHPEQDTFCEDNLSIQSEVIKAPDSNANHYVPLASSVPLPSTANLDIPAVDLRRARSETGIYSSSGISDSSLSESYSKSIANIDCTSSSLPTETDHEQTISEDNNNTETETNADTHSIDSTSIKSSRRERIRERASEMAMRIGGVGRAKVNEFWNRRSKHASAGDSFHQSAVELATEAEELGDEETPRENGKGSPTYGLKKKLASMRKPSPKYSKQLFTPTEDSPKRRPSSNEVVKKATKPVSLSEDVMWGQSLHFNLDKKTTKFLNISVYAKPEGEDATPILLGYNYVYLAQVVADCNLTASNCHREVFHLKPPAQTTLTQTAEIADLSKHPGFDARLCYGDIKLGFRFFPDGLPEGFLGNGDESRRSSGNASEEVPQGDETARETVAHPDHVALLGTESPSISHLWTTLNFRSGQSFTCQSCNGKIWLKSASRCTTCNVICHTKCMQKANSQIECKEAHQEPQHDNDDQFELLTNVTEENEHLDATLVEAQGDHSTPPITRRRRIANKVSEKLSYWRSSKKKNSPPREDTSDPNASAHLEHTAPPSPTFLKVMDVIPEIVNSLQGSPSLAKLRFEVGNSYNEMIINEARASGADVFQSEAHETRRLSINAEIDKIQTAINETTAERRVVLQSKTGDDSDEFQKIEIKLQALALLMLHYCAGLQNCVESEEIS
ncbi:hypothetical protein QR680_012379 [Steinernema hermaphroditum]|uniref:PDZ domain-containing protein 8 n=1 Tax=Steinernema hermaphroditum TaxID=289476 RepID=A0AA39M0N5_9BILA|nr:hypothetical protein QR680_012379 [Steinernema hermaphroditum]